MLVATLSIATVAAQAAQGIDIGNQIFIYGATVKCPAKPAYTLDATNAAAFMQSWLFDSIAGHPVAEKPPAKLPVCNVTVSDRWQNPQPGTLLSYYATDGTNVWLGFPAQAVGPGVEITSDKWIRGSFPQRTRDAIAGHGTVVPLPAAPATTPSTVAGSASPKATSRSSSGSSSAWVIVAVVLGALVIAGAAILVPRSRAKRATTAP